jgi:hypothetical protein
LSVTGWPRNGEKLTPAKRVIDLALDLALVDLLQDV